MKRIQFYVTDEEYAILERHAAHRSYPRIGDFVKHAAVCFVRRYPENDLDREFGIHVQNLGKD